MRNHLNRINDRIVTAAILGGGALAASQAGAAGDWDLGNVQGTVTTLIATGVTVTLALVAFKVGKRAANKV